MCKTKNFNLLIILAIACLIALYAYSRNKEEQGATTTKHEKTEKSISTTKESNSTSTTKASNKPVGYEIPVEKKGQEGLIISHYGYTLSYNKKHNTPNWSAWKLTKAHTDGPIGRSQKFWADPDIPRAYRVDYYDYKDSGYDRGHMCPAADMKWNREAMHDCFYMSNMCPQTHNLNAGSWKTLEDACRRWAIKEGAIYIVCGPVYKGTKHERIGIDHVIDVPEGFFKAVLSLKKGKEKAIAFYYDNNERNQPMSKTARSVDEIESITGLDLFAAVDNKLENKIEASFSLKDWR